MNTDEKDELLQRIRELEERKIRLFARNRSLPLLTTTLTIQQLKALMLLGLDGDLSSNELAEGLGTGVATLTGIVDRLMARGLVHRWEAPEDRRVRRVGLTEEGRRVVAEFWGAGQRHYALLAQLDADTLRGLATAAEALCRFLESEEPQDGDEAPLQTP
ncbi:hypothetical protein GCM10022402_03310 [Salinactinospora qingdaonensis]|uniref:HTH marR-type domain-containing protein n=1 Tax=Salinactinospora qingdaonensis TaxID=702744 RepID=A0ABP7EVQ9_9ACTN